MVQFCVFVVQTCFKIGGSVIVILQFHRHFHVCSQGQIPSHNTIKLWVKNFISTNSTVEQKPKGRPRLVRIRDNVGRVIQAVLTSPQQPVRRQVAVQ